MNEIIIVSDLMVPLDEYATVNDDATLYEAVMALEKAQEKLDRKLRIHPHRTILVYDTNKKITGKILNYGSLYNTLYLLVRRGLVESRESEPLSKQGGRRKVLYTMTREGEKALSNAQRVHKLAWGDVPEIAFEKKK